MLLRRHNAASQADPFTFRPLNVPQVADGRAVLSHHVDLDRRGLRWRYRVAIASQALEMKLDGFPHQLDNFVARVCRRYAAGEIGRIG